MARPPTGTIHTHQLADGTRAFHLRVRRQRPSVIGSCCTSWPAATCGCGGGWDERGARTELGNLLRPRSRRRLDTRRSQRARSRAAAEQSARVPTFHEYATYWLAAKIDGVIGDTGGISQNTIHDYRTRLSVHLLPFFARYRLDEIDGQLCLDFKAFKLAQSRELRDALDRWRRHPRSPGPQTRDRSRSPPCAAS